MFCDIRNVVSVCIQNVNGSFLLPRRIYKKAAEDTVHVVVGSLQFQLTTKNEIGSPFRGSLSHFFVGAILQQPPL